MEKNILLKDSFFNTNGNSKKTAISFFLLNFHF